ncbi:hypothetical protein GCM10011529_09680 [Polymorphobacter glacialis]|uniref:Uncharacterized protein n=1 Tax=Sandarakinorhabdus glacialis TaxID=1614636 RepID=A0A916ZMU4_9SPHN|nr:hypothetical protein [Polymorphobacter glacialis]GGE05343.1 hypothetical protein GCM10011529_09680 [Polymorphobacter glacialis]
MTAVPAAAQEATTAGASAAIPAASPAAADASALALKLVQSGGVLRSYVVSNEGSAHGFAGRFVVTLLFPK